MTRSAGKIPHDVRRDQMLELYSLRAWSDDELASHFGSNRSVIFRDRKRLEQRGYPLVEEEHGRYRIDSLRSLARLNLTYEEMLAVFVSSRHTARHTYSAQPAVASALRKIARVMHRPMMERLLDAADRVLDQQPDPRKAAILRTLLEGWIDGVTLRVDYTGLRSTEPRTFWIQPYLLEPSYWSDGLYVVGPCEAAGGDFAALKVDRIHSVVKSMPGFTIPESFDEAELLKHAWGIWRSGQAPRRVVLKFAPGPASRRVSESVWIPGERQEAVPDGRLWTADVAEPLEMLPWLRGWGADVEVLGPQDLRERLVQETIRLSNLYGSATNVAKSPDAHKRNMFLTAEESMETEGP